MSVDARFPSIPPIFYLKPKLGLTDQVFDLKLFIWNLSAVKKRELIAYLVPNIFASCLVAAGILVQILVLINSRKFTLSTGNLVTQSLIINLVSAPYDTVQTGKSSEWLSFFVRTFLSVSAEIRGLAAHLFAPLRYSYKGTIPWDFNLRNAFDFNHQTSILVIIAAEVSNHLIQMCYE